MRVAFAYINIFLLAVCSVIYAHCPNRGGARASVRASILSHGKGNALDNFELIRVPVKSRTNHTVVTREYYALGCNTICATTLSIGWLDSIRCRALMCITPQTCVTPKSRTGKRIFYRLTSRYYRHYAAFERAPRFKHLSKPTQLLMLTNKQQDC